MTFRTAGQNRQAGESAVECLSQGHNRMARVGFALRLCRSQSRCRLFLGSLQQLDLIGTDIALKNACFSFFFLFTAF